MFTTATSGVYNCHFRRLDFPRRPSQPFADSGRRPPPPRRPRRPQLQDTRSGNAGLRLEEPPRSCAVSLEGQPTHAPLLGSRAVARCPAPGSPAASTRISRPTLRCGVVFLAWGRSHSLIVPRADRKIQIF